MRKLAVLMCVFLILNEFGPAQFLRLRHVKQHELMSNNDKRWSGAAKTLLQYVFKAVQIGGTVANQVTGLLSIISTVYTLLEDCKDTSYGPETKRLNDDIKTMIDSIKAGSPRVYDIQLETKNLQNMIEYVNYNFNNTLEEMEKAGYLSEEFLKFVDPNITSSLDESTLEVEEMLGKAQQAGEKVDYAAVSKSYYLRIDKSVKIAIPIFTSLIPNIPKIYKFAGKRLANLKGWEMTKKFKNIQIPGKNTKAYRGMKSWFSKTSDYIKTAKVNLRTAVTGKYAKALKVVKGLKDGFLALSNYVAAGYNIYTVVQNFNRDDCRKLLEKAKETYPEVVKANQTYNEVLASVEAAKAQMNEIKDDMLEQVSSDVFLEDLRNMKENMISIQGDGNGMQSMIDATEIYLNEIPNNRDIDQVATVMNNLYEEAIGILPHIYTCVNNRAKLVSDVVNNCRNGKDELSNIITDARTFNNYRPEECEQQTGLAFFSEEVLQQKVQDAAEEYGFNKECKLNDPTTLDLICEYHCKPKSPSEISEKINIPVTEVESVLKECPLCEITNIMKRYICNAKSAPPDTDKEIQEILPQLTLEQIAGVQCP